MEVAPGSKNTMSGPTSPGPGYVFFRIVNIATLIATFACLAQVMSTYSGSDVSTPQSITFMFAVGIIGTVWGILILITFLRSNNVSFTIAFFDLVGCVLCIVGTALLTNTAMDQCAVAKAAVNVENDVSRTNNVGQVCGLLRAAWGLSIANIVFFFLLAVGGVQIATLVADEYRRLGGPVARRTVIEEGYPTQPAVRNVTQTTTAAVPIQPGAPMMEKTSSSRRHRSKSRDGGRHNKYSSNRDSKRRKSSAGYSAYSSGGTRDEYFYPDRRDSRRSSRREY